MAVTACGANEAVETSVGQNTAKNDDANIVNSTDADTTGSADAANQAYGPTPPRSTQPDPTQPDPTQPDPTQPGVAGTRYQQAGPFEVGITTLTLEQGNAVEVLYPATSAASGATDSYRVTEFLPEGVAALIPEGINDRFEIDAQRDGIPSADGPFPVVLFSHGFSAFRLQSSNLMRHIASWGFVVAAPDHPSRNLVGQLGGGTENPPTSLVDLRATRALVEEATAPSTTIGAGLLEGIADVSQVALAGHSAGGGTVVAMAGDPGIAGYISYASGGSDLPDVPSLFMSGALDAVVEPGRTAAAFAAAPNDSWLWNIEGAGHLAFSDLCRIGNGDGGLIGLAEAAGIGALVPDNLRVLATDGCEPPNQPVAEMWPAVDQASIGFLRTVFGLDDVPTGLDDLDLPGVEVTIRQG